MRLGLLGPLAISDGQRVVSVGGGQVRALLILLLLRRNEMVSVDGIVDALWGDEPPKTAAQVVRVYVGQLRKAIEPGRTSAECRRLVTVGAGYSMVVGDDELDITRFERLQLEGNQLLRAGRLDEARESLAEALACWRGSPLEDVAYETFAQAEIARLEELRASALEDRFEVELGLGHAGRVAADLAKHLDAHPYRERPRAQLMLARYRTGRQADALETYREGRQLLARELGIEPSPMLRDLEARILRHDPELQAPSEARPVEARDRRGPRARLRPLGVGAALTVLLAGVVAAAVFLASGGSSASPKRIAPRVALVVEGAPGMREQPPVTAEAIAGVRDAHRVQGLRTRVLWTTGSGYAHRLDAAAGSSDLVVVGATPRLATVAASARRHPRTRFLLEEPTSGDPLFAGARNVTGLDFDNRQLGYMAGYLAALAAAPRRTVSAVAGDRTPSVDALVDGFRAGAVAARPGERVLVDYTRTFVDQQRCEQAADRQIAQGSSVVFDVAGECGFGALQAAATNGVWGIGVDSDLSYLGPHILASAVKHSDRAILNAVDLFSQGRLPAGGDIHLGLASDSIGLVGINDRVPDAVRAKLERVLERARASDQFGDAPAP
jgi:DNA-binding SARP family transcriptional activator/basic membrane lipoprotein Med (substrate-binding protein (PBP1-ABC) superfamily)